MNKKSSLFFDDFHTGKLDPALWNIRATSRIVNKEQQAYVNTLETISIQNAADEDATEGGKILVIQPRYSPNHVASTGKSFDFISGRIDTRGKFEFQYGIVQARMKLPAGSGLWPAFWLLGLGRWPRTGEIDIMESVGENDWISSALHGPGYSSNEGLVNNYYFPSGQGIKNWHIYSVDWTSDQIIFKVDGKCSYRIRKPLVNFNGTWVFDKDMFLVLNLAIGGTYPFKINGCKKPYYGLPISTVELIKQGRSKMCIDWVKVDTLG